MINTHVINFMTSAQTTAVDDKYRLDSPFSSWVDAVREYRITKTRLDVWNINKTSEKYLMKLGLDVNWTDFMFPYMLINFIYINVRKRYQLESFWIIQLKKDAYFKQWF
jgi:hypothetical protein